MADFKFPTEEVELPSKGLVYPKDNPLSSGKVEIKYMTAKEEDILTNQSYIQKGNVLGSLKDKDVLSRCVYPFNRIVVNPHGFVVACTADFHKQLEIGDTTKKSLLEIWNGDEFKYLRNKHLKNELEGIYCNKCINNLECKTTNLFDAYNQKL